MQPDGLMIYSQRLMICICVANDDIQPEGLVIYSQRLMICNLFEIDAYRIAVSCVIRRVRPTNSKYALALQVMHTA